MRKQGNTRFSLYIDKERKILNRRIWYGIEVNRDPADRVRYHTQGLSSSVKDKRE